MASEYLYQPVILRRKAEDDGYRGSSYAVEGAAKPIPWMHDREDAVKLARFLGPPSAVVRWTRDLDSRLIDNLSAVVVDVIGVQADTPPTDFNSMGRVDHKSLTYWPPEGDPVYPNIKEDDK